MITDAGSWLLLLRLLLLKLQEVRRTENIDTAFTHFTISWLNSSIAQQDSRDSTLTPLSRNLYEDFISIICMPLSKQNILFNIDDILHFNSYIARYNINRARLADSWGANKLCVILTLTFILQYYILPEYVN